MINYKIFVLCTLATLCMFLASCDNPFKITNPQNPNFDITKFDFNDYKNDKEMAHVLSVMFPQGTSLAEVDKILGPASRSGGLDRTEGKSRLLGGSRVINQRISSGSLPKRILDDLNNAKTIKQYGEQGKTPTFGWVILVFFDSNDAVIQIFSGGEPAFK